MNYLGKFPKNLQKKIEEIANLLTPYTNRAYLVGGCVRDILLDNEIKDLDIEVYDISPSDFDELMQKSGAKGVGKTFFVYKIGDIDLALPRVERKVGVGHKAFEVEVVDDEKLASQRRDFSMNAMMVSIFDGQLLDFWDGQKSVKNRTISMIDEQSFKEDSLRVLRAIQFSARFGFEIEEKTLNVMSEIELNDLTKPRIFWEFEKLFKSQNMALGFVYMYRLKIFEKIFTCKINTSMISTIEKELKYAQENLVEHLRVYYFLYIVTNLAGFDAQEWCKAIETPLHYQKALKNQAFFKGSVSDKELLTIAIDLPINKWLGNYKENIVKRAKKLGIYESIYTGGITIQDVIKDGFKKENIKIEYRRRVLETIKNSSRE